MRKIIEVVILFATIAIISCATTVRSAMAVAYADVVTLVNAGSIAQVGNPQLFERGRPTRVVQINLNGASAVSASVDLQGSLDAVSWTTISSIPLTKAAQSAVWYNTTVPYTVMRANITAISGSYAIVQSAVANGSNATVTVRVAQ